MGVPERLFRALVRPGLAAALLAFARTVTAAITVEVENPRPFGYVIGDVLQQRILVETPAPYALAEESLPPPKRADLWLERRGVHLSKHNGLQATRYELVLEYQILNSPEEVRTIALPPLALQFRGGERPVEETVAEWPITVAPITPQHVLSRAGLETMRPDAAPPLIDTDRYRVRLAFYAAALAAMGGYLTFRFFGLPFLPGSRGPFARACRDLRRMARRPADGDACREALRRLHRAFDETAGQTVFAEQLESFFTRFPRFAAVRDDTEQFYHRSRQEFFGAGGAAPSFDWLVAFSRRCRAAERQAA